MTELKHIIDWWDEENGIKNIDYFYKNGKREGRYQSWYENGNKWEDCFYKNNKLEGRYQHWYKNGNKWEDYFYKDNKKEGRYQNWYKHIDCFYKNDKYDENYLERQSEKLEFIYIKMWITRWDQEKYQNYFQLMPLELLEIVKNYLLYKYLDE